MIFLVIIDPAEWLLIDFGNILHLLKPINTFLCSVKVTGNNRSSKWWTGARPAAHMARETLASVFVHKKQRQSIKKQTVDGALCLRIALSCWWAPVSAMEGHIIRTATVYTHRGQRGSFPTTKSISSSCPFPALRFVFSARSKFLSPRSVIRQQWQPAMIFSSADSSVS